MSSITLYKSETFQIRAHISVWVAELLLWLALTLVARTFLDLTLTQAVLWGFLAALFHLEGSLLHHLGHAWAAQRTGYPMIGIRLWTLLGMSIYPKDEPEIPAALHRQRAWGGPMMSTGVAIIYLVLALLLRPVSPFWYYLLLFGFLDNFLIFTIGALTPLGFTDGSTLLRYRHD